MENDVNLKRPCYSFCQVGDERHGTLLTTPVSGVMAGAFEGDCEAEEKVVVAGEVVGEVQFLL